jgi:hypothetical protein
MAQNENPADGHGGASEHNVHAAKLNSSEPNTPISPTQEARAELTGVRQVFYQATVRNLVEKSEAGYNKVQTDLGFFTILAKWSQAELPVPANEEGKAVACKNQKAGEP